MKKYKYNINNLDCPNCARKIEESLNKNDKLQNVIINFNTKKISYYAQDLTLKDINELVKEIEPDASVVDEQKEERKEYHLTILLIGLLLGILGLYTNINKIVNEILIVFSFIILLYKPFKVAIKTLIKSKNINENALIVISCIGAYFVGEKMEGIMVVSLYLLGKILEEKAINNTKKEVESLVNIKQDYGNVKEGNTYAVKEINDIKINNILIVKQGEKIPLDGIVVKGKTKLDLKSLTGESELVEVNKNDKVLSGSINAGDIIEIKVTSLYKDSTVAKILELIEEATDKKAKTENLVNKISKFYTPIVLCLAVLVAILLPLITGLNISQSIYRSLTFLVISCPCAIAISVPLSYFTGIGVSSKKGILIKGSNYLDNMSHINKIIFDKTGTLTTGSFEVINIEILDKLYTKKQIIDILVKGESMSNHLVAKSIIKLKPGKINTDDIEEFKEISGKGISYKINNNKILVGTSELCKLNKDNFIHLKINDSHVAKITINDGIKPYAKECIDYLKKENIKTYMFTGDKKEVAENIGKKLNIDEIHYEMLPTDKYNLYESLTEKGKIVVFVGDGINDTPVLKRADIGISMGGVGASSAIEAADIVVMKDELNKITECIKISKYTQKIILENLVFALGAKISILLLSIFGLASMWFAVFADTGVTLLTILNTLRILHKFKKN